MNPSFRCGWGVHQLSCIFSVRKGKKMTFEKFFFLLMVVLSPCWCFSGWAGVKRPKPSMP